MDAAEAIAREQIRHLIARYNHAGDRGRLEELVACFTEDGVLDLEDVDLRGRKAIQRHLSGVVDELAAATAVATLRHHVASVLIELEGESAASASSYFSVYTEVGLDHWGRYRDRLSRVGDAWLIAHRQVHVDGATPSSRMAVKHRAPA